MRIFTVNSNDNTIVEGVTIKEYNINGHRLLGVDVGIFDKPNSSVFKIFNIYDSKEGDVITDVDPMFKPVKYHPDKQYLSAARVAASSTTDDEIMVYFTTNSPESRANLINKQELYSEGKLYSGKLVGDTPRTNRQGETYYHEAMLAVIIIKPDHDYKYFTFIGRDKHLVTIRYENNQLSIVNDEIMERKRYDSKAPRSGTMSNALTEALKQSHRNMWTVDTTTEVYTDAPSKRDRKAKRNKWEKDRKESRWQ